MSAKFVEVKISHLEQFPLKAAKGVSTEQIELANKGFTLDRKWMIVDSKGEFQSQRNRPGLALLQALPTYREELHVRHLPTGKELIVSHKTDGVKTSVRLHNNLAQGIDCGANAADWLADILGTDSHGKAFRLVQADPWKRRPIKEIADDRQRTDFADAYPFLLCTTESLSAVNSKLADKNLPAISMDRFRPNIVITGTESLLAFAEFKFKHLMSIDGNKDFTLINPCKRCVVTTVDQKTAQIPNKSEPLATLAEMNQTEQNGAYFGVNMVLHKGVMEKIKVGEVFYLCE